MEELNKHHLLAAIYYLMYKLEASLADNVDIMSSHELGLIDSLIDAANKIKY